MAEHAQNYPPRRDAPVRPVTKQGFRSCSSSPSIVRSCSPTPRRDAPVRPVARRSTSTISSGPSIIHSRSATPSSSPPPSPTSSSSSSLPSSSPSSSSARSQSPQTPSRRHPPAHPPQTQSPLHQWLASPGAADRARAVIDANRNTTARRFLPGGAAARRWAAATVLDVLQLAIDGIPAAEILAPYLPRILLGRGATISDQVNSLICGGAIPHPPDSRTHDATQLWVARVRSAVDGSDLRALNRLLADGASISNIISEDEKNQVIAAKFPKKPDGELHGGARAEADWVHRWRDECGGADQPITQSAVIRWARAKRHRSADIGGWTGQLILDLHATDPSTSEALASLWSCAPQIWIEQDAAAATWRLAKASFVPQPGKPLPRPVAVASAARRAWAAVTARRVRPAATSYCESRGQYGLSGSDGLTAYALVARAMLARGASVRLDDRSNSFHELHRSAVFDAAQQFILSLSPEMRTAAGRPLVDLIDRTFAGRPTSSGIIADLGAASDDPALLPRTKYIFGDNAELEHDALLQGSPESSLLEALTYSIGPNRSSRGIIRSELHDDGWTAASSINAFHRIAPTDGSRWAESKDKAIGPLAADIVRHGLAKEAASFAFVAGVPIGDEAQALDAWSLRFSTKLLRIDQIAALDPRLAASATMALGGPAGMANHILRAMNPSPHMHFWRRIDDQWIAAWCRIAKVDHTDDNKTRIREALRRCGQHLIEDVAELRYAQGIDAAATQIEMMIGRAGLKVDRSWWRALGVEAWHDGRSDFGSSSLRAAARRRVASLHPPTRSDSQPPNMWEIWASRPPPERLPTSASTSALTPELSIVGLRRMLGLSIVGPATGITTPRSCARCGAPAIPDGVIVRPAAGPRAQVDHLGEHALTCRLADGDVQRRHNQLAFAIRDCTAAAGFASTCHAGQVFDSHNGRPADIWVEGYPGHRAGLAIDCTIVSATDGRNTAANREQRKISKYSAEVARHPELGFRPFAIDLDGRLGPSAWNLMLDWARIQASRKATGRALPESRDWVISTIAYAFATGSIRHIQSYYDKQTRAVSRSGLASPMRTAGGDGKAPARSARRTLG